MITPAPLQKEAAIGLGMTSHAVTQINEGAPLKVVYFEEGSPYTMYGQAMIAGKETRESVKAVFDFLVNTYSYELNEKFFPEQMFKDKTPKIENYPENIVYSDMSNNTVSRNYPYYFSPVSCKAYRDASGNGYHVIHTLESIAPRTCGWINLL